MAIITITLRALGHTIFELTIDAPTIELEADDDDQDTTVIHDVNLAHFDTQPD